jgi:hypothetical protein
MSGKVERDPNVIWRKIDDSVVIIKEDGTKFLTLNNTAAYIWEKCNGEMDAKAIATKLQEQFTVSFEETYDDVLNALKILEDNGLLKKGTV